MTTLMIQDKRQTVCTSSWSARGGANNSTAIYYLWGYGPYSNAEMVTVSLDIEDFWNLVNGTTSVDLRPHQVMRQ